MGAVESVTTSKQVVGRTAFVSKSLQNKTMVPILLDYVKSKYHNICSYTLSRPFGSDRNTFQWFHPMTDIGRDPSPEVVRSAEEDGYQLVYKNMGVMFVAKTFVADFIDCNRGKMEGFTWFDVAVQTPSGSHVIPLIFNAKTKTFELYDSNGWWNTNSTHAHAAGDLADNASVIQNNHKISMALTIYIMGLAQQDFARGMIDENKPIASIEETCPRTGLQELEENYSRQFRARFKEQNVAGYCSIWSVMILDERLANPDKEPWQVIANMLKVPSFIDRDQAGGIMRQKVHNFVDAAYTWFDPRK